MNLNRGRPYVAIPGPSVIPDQVLQAMHRSAPNIYSSDLEHMVHGLLDDLRVVAGTDGYSTIYIANGHGVWEAALSNTMSRGVTGSWSWLPDSSPGDGAGLPRAWGYRWSTSISGHAGRSMRPGLPNASPATMIT